MNNHSDYYKKNPFIRENPLLEVKLILLIFLLFIQGLSLLPAKEKIGDKIKLGTEISLGVDSKDIPAEYYDLSAKLKFYYEPIKTLEFKIETEFEPFKVSLDELWGRWDFSVGKLKFGLYENELLPDDVLNSSESPFASDSLFRDHLSTSGWYTNEGLGASVSFKDSPHSFSGSFSTFLSASVSTVFFTGNLFYKLKESSLGLTASYMPVYYKQSDESEYYLFTLYAENLKDNKNWNYSAGISMGKNIGDPAGGTHAPDAYKSESYFGAFDGFLSYHKGIWTPTFGSSYIMYDLDYPQACSFDNRIGNKFSWNDMFFIFTDIGLRTNIYYEPDLTTGLEFLWAAEFQFRY